MSLNLFGEDVPFDCAFLCLISWHSEVQVKSIHTSLWIIHIKLGFLLRRKTFLETRGKRLHKINCENKINKLWGCNYVYV